MASVDVIKVLLIGDIGVGKTSLAKTITDGAFPSASMLSRTDDTTQSPHPDASNDQCLEHRCNKETIIRAGDNHYDIHIFDPDSESTMTNYLSLADICYLCFDITNPRTMESINSKWLPFLTNTSKLILVGLKSDLAYDKSTCQLLESQGLHPIKLEAGRCLANQLKASQYVEVSALKYLGIEQLKDKTLFDFVNYDGSSPVQNKKTCTIS